jgi:hypothetical protein
MRDATIFIVAAMLSMGTAARAGDFLPIERGYYVSSDTSCQQASNATIVLYNGVSFGSAHVECRKPLSKKLTADSYQITDHCRDMQGRGGSLENIHGDIYCFEQY